MDSESEKSPNKESYKINEEIEDSKENDAGVLLTISVVDDHPKMTLYCLIDSGSSSSLFNYDVSNRNVTSKERHKEV